MDVVVITAGVVVDAAEVDGAESTAPDVAVDVMMASFSSASFTLFENNIFHINEKYSSISVVTKEWECFKKQWNIEFTSKL